MRISDQITADTWCQGSGEQDGKRCLLKWIDYCYPAEERREVEMRLINRIFGDAIRRNDGKRKLGMCLSVWNDARGRTVEDVIKVTAECGV